MSGRPNKEDDSKSSGLGLLGGLAVAGGAAALGFMASSLWNGWKAEEERCSRQSQSHRPLSQNRPSPRSRMEKRKQRQNNESNEDIPAGQRCIICFDNPREVVIEPCNHVCICENCAERVGSTCPLCRAEITQKKEVYL